jgi:excisionase family DNA binding protein
MLRIARSTNGATAYENRNLQSQSRQPDTKRPLHSVEETGAILGLRKSAVYELMAHGDLPFVAVTPRHRMVKASDLEDFIDTRRTGGWNRR